MKLFSRILALIAVFIVTSLAWIALGGVMKSRSNQQEARLEGDVAGLWGEQLVQRAPGLKFDWTWEMVQKKTVEDGHGRVTHEEVLVEEVVSEPREPLSTDISLDLSLDQRRKGLLWFSLYDVAFSGEWSYRHDHGRSGTLWFELFLPSARAIYDGLVVTVDGESVDEALNAGGGALRVPVAVRPGQEVVFHVAYRSWGMDRWQYAPTAGVGEVKDFNLSMSTDFTDIDFPPFTMSPSSKEQLQDGWKLDWSFERLVTSHGMGMVMPQKIQPGDLGARMSWSAPLSLGFFMVWVFVLGLLRGVDVHPMNHVFLAAAFFSFHLLFAYVADHLPVGWAFGLSAVTSMFLVVSYLRLVVGPRFAFVEAGLAQLLYLVGFSLAHFWEGFTGLTVTVLAVITLFALMQLTGRILWAEVFGGRP